MSPVRSFGILLVFGFLGIPATALPAETGAVSQVTVYPPAFFAAVQPTSAYDMLTVLPGYVFTESDSDVRGFTGAVGSGERTGIGRRSAQKPDFLAAGGRCRHRSSRRGARHHA